MQVNFRFKKPERIQAHREKHQLLKEEIFKMIYRVFFVLLWTWSAYADVSLDLEEQFRQLNENYMQFKDKVVAELKEKDQQNKVLLAKVNQLETKFTAWQSEKMSAGHNSTKVLRQATAKVPTSRLDVYINGQTTDMATSTPFSGIYLIMGQKFVETVFCDFTKPTSDPGSQKWIGYADIKSAPIYFYVQRNTAFSAVNVPIPFQIERVNIGKAMDLPSGKFTAPRDGHGTYFFSFAGLAQFPNSTNKVYLKIALYSDGACVGTSESAETNTAGHSSALNLQTGVQVWLQAWAIAAGVSLWDTGYHHTHFTGWILQEEIANSLL